MLAVAARSDKDHQFLNSVNRVALAFNYLRPLAQGRAMTHVFSQVPQLCNPPRRCVDCSNRIS